MKLGDIIMLNFLKTFFSKYNSTDQELILEDEISKKVKAYSYGLKVGKRLKLHFKETGKQQLSTTHIPIGSNLSFYLGFEQGLGSINFNPSYEVQEINTTVSSPFSFETNPKDFAKSQNREEQIYLRHS